MDGWMDGSEGLYGLCMVWFGSGCIGTGVFASMDERTLGSGGGARDGVIVSLRFSELRGREG